MSYYTFVKVTSVLRFISSLYFVGLTVHGLNVVLFVFYYMYDTSMVNIKIYSL